ncbi:MAG: cytochrome c biogenesis protein CcdA [Vicinamibacterales bacterium]
MTARGLRAGATIVLALVAGALLWAQGAQPFPLTALLEGPTAHAGSTVRALLKLEIPKGLHVQSNAPRDPSLIPTTLSFVAVPGVTVREVVFPKSTTATVRGYSEPLDVFEGDLLIGVQFVLGPDVAVGPLALPARLLYQACTDSACLAPKTVQTSWTIEIVRSSSRPLAKQTPTLFEGIAFGHGLPPPPPPITGTPAQPSATASASTAAAPTGDVLALFDQFDIAGSAGGYRSTAEFLQFIHDAEAGVKPKGAFEGRGPLAILAIVFIGGLALNLTPCVLPMIPINLAIIGAGAQGGRRGRGFVLGLVYGGAMALVYGVLGLVVILTAGTFGTINASPWFNVAIAILFVALGLAMFDVISIDFSRLSSKIQFKQESRGTMMLAFGMGAVAALLAGACVAPVVIQVVVFSSGLYAAGTTAALALPFVLGLGMALPWPLAGAGIASLPKPGAWMVRVKQVMGVFIIGTALYYGYLAYEIFSNRWVDPESVSASVQEQLQQGWHSSIAEGLQKARTDRSMVLIDFWATWCKNCLVMDKTTLADPAVKQALSQYTRIKFQADDPDASPAKELLKKTGAAGLPHYAILRPR